MTILAIETATDICGTALVRDHAVLSQKTLSEKNIHSEKLLPMIDEILKEAAVQFQNVNAIAVSIGPGSFTGLRIGLSAAKGLAMAASLPLILVPTLDAMALEFHRKNPDTGAVICPLIDAKRDEAFFSFYSIQNDLPFRKSDYEIASAQTIIQKAKIYPLVIFVGEGAGKIKSAASQQRDFQFRNDIVCSAVSVALLAEAKFSELKTEEYSMLEPLYLREFVTTQPKADQPPGEKPNSLPLSSETHIQSPARTVAHSS
jgi:tRNA threonylcarbamoyladenosine biosynthesis protein TsaB